MVGYLDVGRNIHFPHLFSPLQVGRRTLRNRIALPATTTNYGARNRVTDRWISFLAERAKGGAGMVISEIIAVDPAALCQASTVTGYEAANEDGFKRAAAAIEGEGACAIAQLWHPGRQQLWSPVASPKGISDQPDAYSWTVPHVMSTAELRQVADEYVAVATRFKQCGFGGVELHGAHGYLITQILSPWSNRRNDDYGGSLENRIRFVREVAQSVRQSCGADFVIGLKMPGDEGVAGGIDPDEAARITAALAQTGALDYFAYSQGNFTLSLENHAPDMHFRRGHFLDIHKKMRLAANGTPVMALGRIATPAEAESAIADGAGDLVGMTRALIADADWPAKARDGRADDIRPSSFDNFAWGEIHVGRALAEPHNPQLGRTGESAWRPGRAPKRRRVVVAGAGPAGLQAARIAAERGHDVTLFGASTQAGGKLRWEGGLPGKAEHLGVVAWMERQARSRRRQDRAWACRHRRRHSCCQAGQRRRRDRLASAPAGQFFRRRRERARLDGAAGRRPHRCNGGAVRHGPQRRDLCGRRRAGARLSKACAAHAASADRAQRQLLQHDRRPSPAV